MKECNQIIGLYPSSTSGLLSLTSGDGKNKIAEFDGKRFTFTPFPCPFSILAIALFIYLTFVQTGTEARTEVK